MSTDNLHETDNFIRFRQEEPWVFDENTFRTIRLKHGIKAVVGKKKGETRHAVQSILFEKSLFSQDKANGWMNRHSTKLSDAVNMEDQKVSLFDEDPLTEHADCHLPPLSPNQIKRLMEIAGPADDMPSEDIPMEENPDLPQPTTFKNEIDKYVKLV